MKLFWPGFHAYELWWRIALDAGVYSLEAYLALAERDVRDLWERGRRRVKWAA